MRTEEAIFVGRLHKRLLQLLLLQLLLEQHTLLHVVFRRGEALAGVRMRWVRHIGVLLDLN